MKRTLLSTIALLLSVGMFAQQVKCYSTEVTNMKRANDPVYDHGAQLMENAQRKWVNSGQVDPYLSARAVRTIPVVVHVVYKSGALNVSDAVIQQMIAQLNQDYIKANSDLSQARSSVQGLAADAQIQFCLAQQTPSGASTTGIEHVLTTKTCFDPDTETDDMKSTTTGGANAWDPYHYLNVWIVSLCGSSLQTGGTGGYSYIPTSNNGLHGNSIDGVVLDDDLGTYTGSRALTHEIGHYLGLHHTWGDLASNACGNTFPNTDDGFSDTPDEAGPNYNCTVHNTCSATNNTSYGDLFEDFMDYGAGCAVLFTTQQVNWMNNVLTNVRSSLVTNNNKCSATGAPVANFTATPTSICAGQTVQFTSTSTGTSLTYSWSFPGGTPSTSTAANPTVTYNTAGSYNVTLTVTSGSQNNTKTQTAYITVASSNALPLTEGFEATTFPPTGWALTNGDAATTWVRTTSASGFGTSSASAYMNDYQYSSPGEKDWLITPAYNFSGVTAGRIKWDYAYVQDANYLGNIDSLEVFYSTNCGSTWTSLWRRGGSSLSTGTASASNFVPTSTQWKKDSVSLASLSGQASVRFAFVCTNGYGNNIFLDNVNIYNSSSQGGSAPVADFVGSPTTVVVGNTVSFTDLSTNNPTSWSWSFPGGATTTSTAQNPTITYNTVGTYNVSLTATNGNGNNSVTKTAYITVVNQGSGQSCDTLSNLFANDTLTIYTFNPASGATGYVTGHNSLQDKGYAEYFPNTVSSQVSGALFYFARAKTTHPTTSSITAKVWNANGAGGSPGTVLASQTVLINTIATDVTNQDLTYVAFSSPPTVTGNFFVGYEMTYLAGDTVVLVSTQFNSPLPDYGWGESSASTWAIFDSTYGVGFDLAILPVVCTGTSGTGPTASFTANNTAVCAGSSVTFTSTSTGSPTSYSWTFTGGTPSASSSQNPTVTYNTAGTYNVSLSVSNANGSNTATQSNYITVYAKPTATTTSTAVACFGASTGSATVAPAGGTTPYTYNWSGGAGTTASISNKPAGTYTVTVTDAHQCSVTSSVNIGQPLAALSATPTTTSASCGQNNGSATVAAAGGAGNYTYHWNNNATTQTINNLGAGTYTVTVTDANSCTASATMTVTNQAANFSASITATDPTCGQNNGTAVALVSNSNLTITGYTWSNGSTAGSLSNLAPGTYSVTVTVSTGCTASATTTISGSASSVAVTFSITQANCGTSNGGAVATATGGTTPYTYNWSNGGNTNSISNVPAGGYTLTVSDASGCSVSNVANISNAGAPTVSISPTSPTCYGGNNGSALAAATGGTTPYNYNWSSGATIATASNLSAGTYTVTVTDASTCLAVQSVTITNPAQVTVSIASTTATCGSANGTVTATGSGGSGSFVYTWSTGASQATVSSLAGGSYTVTVTDSHGCSVASNAQVASVPGPTTSVGVTNGTCQVTASVNLTVNGGTTPYTYAWSNGASTEDLSPVAAGSYTVTVTDANGCKSTNSASVTDASNITLTFSTQDPTSGNNGSITANPAGGTTPYTYNWSNGGNTATINNLAAGTYTVTVTDQTGCIKVASVSLIGTGINTVVNIASIKVFPNPAGSNCNIMVELNEAQNVSFEIFNSVGQSMWSKEMDNFTAGTESVNMSNFAQGIYIVRIKVKDTIQTVRLVKE